VYRFVSLLPAAAFLGAVLSSCEKKPLADGGAKVVVVRTAASDIKDLDEIAPYDEALVWHEYEVKEVLEGILTAPKIRVAHWSVIRGKNVAVGSTLGETTELKIRPYDKDDKENFTDVVISDDLDIVAEEPPRFMDMGSILAQGQTPGAVRYDYDSLYSDQMQLYWQLRHQLELVVLGNSHAAKGIRPSMLLGEANKNTPQAFNMGAGGANVDMQCMLARDYILPLPKLKTLVWLVSARTFNEELSNTQRRFDIFKSSPGYDYDREHWNELWPVSKDAPQTTVADLQKLSLNLKKLDPWGWSGRDKTLDAKGLSLLPEKLSHQDFDFDKKAWKTFASVVNEATAKGVKVYIMTSPIHPLSKDTPAADPDGSTHQGQAETVARLKELDASNPLVWFWDVNKSGAHDFEPEQFYDVDHLNLNGATDLTQRVATWITETQNAAVKN